ncbi:NAD(P)-dependent oxidoreductase [Atopobium sp. oral taxon 199]|uniref:NAD(P)-dependent oxidoreductase n=1 Tax=Atopobium sp. oral taxon 199 TaxID=712156 RepID=UPI00034EA87C|nr:NAD(P)H-binding protein [Atopobium sp. oral taxon 199]EPD77530.1 hypothetical protein HMPREF1527_01463 [Atopobium sp. oral taxon 199 str. F0494]
MAQKNMTMAVVAANGKAGRLIVKEAVDRGFDVTAIARSENKTTAQHFIKKDIMDLTREDLQGFDVVIDAFGTWAPGQMSQHSTTLGHLSDLLANTDTRLLVVGGAGSLYVNPEHTMMVSETPDFPDAFQAVVQGMAAALAELRKRDNVKWTYISPAGDFQAEGERTGAYILAGEELTLNDEGESIISYADYAIAMIDEAESGNHIQERISVVRK